MAANNFLTISGDDAITCIRMLRGKNGLKATRTEHRVNMRKVAKADSIESLAGFRIVAKAACPEGHKLGKPLAPAEVNASYDIGIWVDVSHAPGLRYVAYVNFATSGPMGRPAKYHTCMGPGETAESLLGSEFKLAKNSACAKALAKRKAAAKAKAKAKPKASAKTQEAVVEAVADVVAEDAPSGRMGELREFKALFPDATFADAVAFFA